MNAKLKAVFAAVIGLLVAIGLASGFGLFGGPSDNELIQIGRKAIKAR